MIALAALGRLAMGGLKAGAKMKVKKVATDKLLNRKKKTNKRRASAKKIMGLEDEEKDLVIKPQNSLVPLSIKTTTIPTENLITTKGDSIKDKLFMIKDLLELQLKLRLSSWAETIKNRREERRKEREKEIEEKKQTKKKSPSLNLLPKTGILDSLKNFLMFVAGGFLLNLLLKNFDVLEGIGKAILSITKGIMQVGKFLWNTVIGFIVKAYDGYDALRESVRKIGGDEAVEKFERVSDLLKTVINGAIIAATLALVTSPFRGGGFGRGRGLNVPNRNFGSNARTNKNINPNRSRGVTTGKGKFTTPQSNTLKNLKKGIKPQITNLGRGMRLLQLPWPQPPIGFEYGKGTFSATQGRAPLIPQNTDLTSPFRSLTSSADRTFTRPGPLSGIRKFATNIRNRIPFLNPNVSQGSNVVSRNLSKLNPFNKKVSVGGNILTRNLSKLNLFNKTVTTGMGGGGAPSGSKGLVGFLKNIRIPIPKWLTGWKGNALINTIFAAFEFRGRKKRGQSNLKAITGTGSGVAGGFAGFWAGSKIGASIGAAIGAPFAGIGAGPGALIGGILGGIAGSMGGSALAGSGSDAIIDQIEKPNEQDFTKNIKSIDELSQNTSYSQGSYGLISEITTFIQPVIQEV